MAASGGTAKVLLWLYSTGWQEGIRGTLELSGPNDGIRGTLELSGTRCTFLRIPNEILRRQYNLIRKLKIESGKKCIFLQIPDAIVQRQYNLIRNLKIEFALRA